MIRRSTIARAESFAAMKRDGMTIAEIAQQSGYSPGYVTRLISEVTPPPTSQDPLYWQRALKVAMQAVQAEPEAFLGRAKKSRQMIHARWAVMAGMRKRGASLHQVGKRLNRDHTSVVYALRQVEYLAKRDESVARLIELVDAA